MMDGKSGIHELRALRHRAAAPRPRHRRASVLEISGVSIPAGEVGGDLLELLPCGRRGTAVYVADVMGKGASASLLGSKVREAFRDVASVRCDPAEACGRVNRTLCDEFAAGQFATGFYALIDRQLGTMRHGLQRALLSALDRFSAGRLRDDVTLGVLAVSPALGIPC